MKKLIGITASTNKLQQATNTAYIKAFSTETTTPIILPCLFENENEVITKKEQENLKAHIDKIIATCDAIVLSGGVDLSPISISEKLTDSESFNINRDIFEKELVTACINANKPILGICRGFQLLGNMLGLNYFQQDISITDEIHNGLTKNISLRKEPMHAVHLFGELKKYIEQDKICTNSWHHQGFTLMPEGERVKNKDMEDFVTEKRDFHEETKATTKDPSIVIKEIKTKGKKLNNFGDIDILMATNCVIEGFKHKTLPIVAFQNHPEEYTNSIAINYFLETYLIK